MRTLYTLAYPTLAEPDRQFIERLRQVHDARFRDLVAVHFTLVFACAAIAPEAYIEHVSAVALATRPLQFCCRYAMLGADDGTAYVYLVPDEGFSALALLHDALYRGLLEPHLRLDIPFVPHITVCTTAKRAEAKAVCDELNGRGLRIAGAVDTIDVCRLEHDRVRSLARFELEGPHAQTPR